MNYSEPRAQVLCQYQKLCTQGTEYDRKHVYRIECGDCDTTLTDRGMNAVLLSDRSVQLFSTDLFPDTVAFIHGDYAAASCSCRVRDIGCKNCGNVVGYHVNVPCKSCLSQPNNGHYWMFRSFQIKSQPILIKNLSRTGEDLNLLWGLVVEAGYFNDGPYRTGDDEAARKSCQLSVRFSRHLDLFVKKPTLTLVPTSNFDPEKVLQVFYPCLR